MSIDQTMEETFKSLEKDAEELQLRTLELRQRKSAFLSAFITSEEARGMCWDAGVGDVSRQDINTLIKVGRLKGRRMFNRAYTTPEWVAEYIELRALERKKT